ncbi:hypothetical protein ARMSODRAFT_1023666 [Armillaria solidipes]|uniref:RING-type domain-containing protein n=1 Tax=Armillaria solidipes TaxID=1076256 RepID=A0A2H3BCK7_9AGAR|nr:hypothetical protein ARMSODRAFT_1023666 [Armillaria solidipes]
MPAAKSELELLRLHMGELLEEVDELKDELKKVKAQAEACQMEADWWRVTHYQYQFRIGQQVHDLEDEIKALQEENTQARHHSREAATERQQNRLRRDTIFDLVRCFMCFSPATEACILRCGHSYHVECLIRHFRLAIQSDGTPPICPECRDPVLVCPICNRILEEISSHMPDAEADSVRHEALWAMLFPAPESGTESEV